MSITIDEINQLLNSYKTKIQELTEVFNTNLIRLISITDEQYIADCQEEYTELTNQIAELSAKIQSLEDTKETIELIHMYEEKFVPASFMESIYSDDKKNISSDITNKLNTLRIRFPKNLQDARVLNLMLQALNCPLVILDYQGYCYKTIGSGENPSIYVTCKGFTDSKLSNFATNYTLDDLITVKIKEVI